MMKLCLMLSTLIIMSIVGLSVYGWISIDESFAIARHWNLNGEADGFSPRNHVLIGFPLLAIALSALFYFVPKIDPRPEHIRLSGGLLAASWLGALSLLLAVYVSIIFPAARGETSPPLPQLTLYAVSVLVIVIGNFTAKSRSNFFLGVRTPWTLSSENAWIAANRIAGWAFVLAGAGAVAASFIESPVLGWKILIAGIVAGAIAAMVVSYLVWRADPDRGNA